MEKGKTSEKDAKKRKSNNSAFLGYAIIVFTALAVSIIVILLRSKA